MRDDAAKAAGQIGARGGGYRIGNRIRNGSPFICPRISIQYSVGILAGRPNYLLRYLPTYLVTCSFPVCLSCLATIR